MNSPTPQQIKQARKDAGLTQTKAAALLYKSLRCWQQWESDECNKDHRKMDAAFWELFQLKISGKDFRCAKNEPCNCTSLCGDDK